MVEEWEIGTRIEDYIDSFHTRSADLSQYELLTDLSHAQIWILLQIFSRSYNLSTNTVMYA